MSTEHLYEKLEEKFCEWAPDNEDIRAAFVVGSRARNDMPADEWSDLDLVILAADPGKFLYEKEWLNHFGEPVISFLENTAVVAGRERRVLFDGGCYVDFIVFPAETSGSILESPDVQSVLERGFRILEDKDRLLEGLSAVPVARPVQTAVPTEAVFQNAVNDFWFHAILGARKLCRGELLEAKSICDTYMKDLLIDMIKLYTNVVIESEAARWHGSRFFEKWAGPDMIERFGSIYALYDEDSVWDALHETKLLYGVIAQRSAEALRYEYPYQAEIYALKLFDHIREEQRRRL